MNVERGDENIYFNPGDFWSHQEPVPLNHPVPVVVEEEEELPPIEQERYVPDTPASLRVSPCIESAGSSRLRSDRVYVLPEDDLHIRLSPRSRRRARTLHLHPGQEYMRSSIARSLTPLPAPSRPEQRFLKSLGNIILGKK